MVLDEYQQLTHYIYLNRTRHSYIKQMLTAENGSIFSVIHIFHAIRSKFYAANEVSEMLCYMYN